MPCAMVDAADLMDCWLLTSNVIALADRAASSAPHIALVDRTFIMHCGCWCNVDVAGLPGLEDGDC